MASYTNYAAYLDPTTQTPRIGHLDFTSQQIHPLCFASGTPLSNLYQVIEAGPSQISRTTTAPLPLSSVTLLPPISGRDILAVGKNYVEHAQEFHSSGFDKSDVTAQPSHPVIFTKRATSIIAHGEPILPHAGFTSTADYEGEIGVIVGKAGFGIREEDALEHVWGFTIVNDVTAREKQRDHKQFFLGKSPDSFCPVGPVAVPKESLPVEYRQLKLCTRVNGELRQEASLADLIFSIPRLIATISAAQTLQLGDLLATGTPVGVGFGFRPMKFLKEGDEVAIAVTGLGELVNRVAAASMENRTLARVQAASTSSIPVSNTKAPDGAGLTCITDSKKKKLFYARMGNPEGPPVVFVHGLGGSSTYFTPLVAALQDTHSLHLVDLEGHGLSPTSALSSLSIGSFADDVYRVMQTGTPAQGITVAAHSMGCLVALKLALLYPELVSRLVLMGPPPSPLPVAASQGSMARAALVREKGMVGVVDAVVGAGTSARTQAENPLAVTAVRMSLLAQDAEGYAKACTALAGSVGETLEVEKVTCPTLVVTGDADKVSPAPVCEAYVSRLAQGELKVLEGVGHWHLVEDVKGCVEVVERWLS